MIDKDILFQLNDKIYSIQLYINLAITYIEKHDEIQGLAPILLTLEKIEEQANLAEEIINNYES